MLMSSSSSDRFEDSAPPKAGGVDGHFGAIILIPKMNGLAQDTAASCKAGAQCDLKTVAWHSSI